MNTYLLTRSFGALLLANLGSVVTAQDGSEGKGKGEEQRRVRIEISRNENGRVSHETREFDLNNEAELHDALRELGVLDELSRIGDGENLTFDLRRMNEDGLLNDMSVALAWPSDQAYEAPEPQPYMGVYYDDFSNCKEAKAADRPPVKDGALLTNVEEGSPADAAGLVKGDVVVDIAGTHVAGGEDLVQAVAEHKPGDKVKVTYYRGKSKKNAEVVIGERPDPEEAEWQVAPRFGNGAAWDWDQYFGDNGGGQHAFLGVVGGSDEKGGVRVGEVVPGSAAEKMGLKEGDILRSINGDAITDFSDLADHVSNMSPGNHLDVSIARDGKAMMLSGEVGGQYQSYSYEYNGDVPEPPSPPEPYDGMSPPMPPTPPGAQGWTPEVRDELRAEMDRLRAEMDRLRHELRGGATHEMHVDISAGSIAKEDVELLKSKGVTGLDQPLDLNGMQTYPEAGDQSFHIAFQVPERGDLSVDVHNAAGERVYHETISGFKGNYERVLDLSDQADGTYFLVIVQNGHATARKLIKK